MKHASKYSRLSRLSVITALAVGAGPLIVKGQSVNERKVAKVKSAYLVNFAKFVTWPAMAFDSPDAPIVIGVLGADSFGSILDETVDDKKVGQRSFVVRRLNLVGDATVDAKALRRCHILYVSESESDRLRHILRLLEKADVLVVGEDERSARYGAMIAFVLDEHKIVFHINRDTIEETNVKISSKLMKLAKVVYSKK